MIIKGRIPVISGELYMEDLNSASAYTDSRDNDGFTLPHIASLACNLGSAEIFVAAGADVCAKDRSSFLVHTSGDC